MNASGELWVSEISHLGRQWLAGLKEHLKKASRKPRGWLPRCTLTTHKSLVPHKQLVSYVLGAQSLTGVLISLLVKCQDLK